MTADGAGQRGAKREEKSLSTLTNELAGLVIGYVKQEALEPVRSLGRFIALGVAGSVLLAVGGVLLALAAVRAIQAEAGPHVTGDLDWVPYVAGILLAAIGAIWAALRIGRGGYRR